MHVIVIGAGVAGATTAWFLQTAGVQVTLLDAATEPGTVTSAGNGGMLHASHAEPWNTPGVAWDLLRYLGRSDSPLLVRPRAVPGLLRWGLEFLWNSRAVRYHAHTLANAQLAAYSLQQLFAIQKGLNLDFALARTGIVKIFQDPERMEQQRAASAAMATVGVRFEEWDTTRLIDEEPLLAPSAHQLCGALYFPDDAVGNCAQFTQALVAAAEARGLHWRPATRVLGWRLFQGRINGVETDQGPWAADAVVAANGYQTASLLRQLGVRVPVAPVKGYSLTLQPKPERQLRLPIIDDANKVVATPLGDRLRLAGTAEFAGADSRLNLVRVANVLRQCRRSLIGLPLALEPEHMQPWTGLRPMSARGTPILGRTPIPGLYLNTGAGHLGWTLACGSAALLRDVILGRKPALPSEPFELGAD